MRFSTTAIPLLIAAASAYGTNFVARQATYPTCATPCLFQAPLGSCTQLADIACLCKNNDFIQNTTSCIAKTCTNPNDLNSAISAGKQACLDAGVTLSSTPVTTPTGSVSSVASSPTPTSTKSDASKTSHDIIFALGAAALAIFYF